MKNPYPWGTHKHRLLDRLQRGPVLNSEIVDCLRIFNYHAAITDLRRDLSFKNVEIIARPVNKKRNHWEYKLVEPGQQAIF
jgi:hypothetical protein